MFQRSDGFAAKRMKTFYSWCAANVGIIGIIQALYTIGITCLFRMEEVRCLGYGPLAIWLFSLFFIWPGKTNSDILVRLLFLFGSIAFICYVPRVGTIILSPETKLKLKLILGIMLLVGGAFALAVTLYVWKNFSEVTSKRMLYRNSPVEMFNIRLNYCIHQFFETLTVMSAIVLLTVSCIELKPIVEAYKAGNNEYWALELSRFVYHLMK